MKWQSEKTGDINKLNSLMNIGGLRDVYFLYGDIYNYKYLIQQFLKYETLIHNENKKMKMIVINKEKHQRQ